MKLNDAIRILEQCSAAVLPEENAAPLLNPLIYPEKDIFMTVTWDDPEIGTFEVEFTKENNQEVEVQGSSLVLKSNEDEKFVITPLFPKELV